MKYYYSDDIMHCSQERCLKYNECYRAELGKMCKGIASFYMPSPDKDLTDCEYFINKDKWRIHYDERKIRKGQSATKLDSHNK